MYQAMTLHEHATDTPPQERVGRCPTCGQETPFVFLGVQRWPARVVEATGCPPVTVLYTCAHCSTTVSGVDIE